MNSRYKATTNMSQPLRMREIHRVRADPWIGCLTEARDRPTMKMSPEMAEKVKNDDGKNREFQNPDV